MNTFRVRSAGSRLALLSILCLALVPVSLHDTAPAESIRFDIGRGVSQEDADYVIEGAWLAANFFASELDYTVPETVNISARDQSAPMNPMVVAMSTGPAIVVYTGSVGWRQSAPFLRIAVVVHEYAHVVEHEWLSETDRGTAAWFNEGLAEYLQTRAIVALGLVNRGDVDGYRAFVLEQAPPSVELAEIERLSDFQREPGSVYDLSYFALSYLLDDENLAVVTRYYEQVAAGVDWRAAFLTSFGKTPTDFYADFDTWRSDLVASSAIPDAYERVRPYSGEATVRLSQTPSSLQAGKQTVFRAASAPNAVCQWQLTYGDAVVPALTHLTVVDGAGRVFWLLTIPDDATIGPATVAVECGAEPDMATVQIVAEG